MHALGDEIPVPKEQDQGVQMLDAANKAQANSMNEK